MVTASVNVFKFSFDSEVTKAKQVVNEVMQLLAGRMPKLTPDDCLDLKLILSELLYNAVIHGNGEDKTKMVHLVVNIKDDFVSCSVADEGVGFDYTHFLSRNESNNAEEETFWFNERGRGIRLVKALVDSLDFNVVGNEIKFCKRVATNGQYSGC